MHRNGTPDFRQILCLIALPCNPVLSWHPYVISTFVADNRLGLCCLWWNTSRETEMQSLFSVQSFFRFHNLSKSLTWNSCSFLQPMSWTRGLQLFKVQHLSFRPGMALNYEMPNPLWKPIFFRKCIISWNGYVLEFWQVWIATKEVYHESGNRSSMFSQWTPFRIAITKFGLRSTCQIWFR